MKGIIRFRLLCGDGDFGFTLFFKVSSEVYFLACCLWVAAEDEGYC